jgi:aminoglycoside 6-adenylyltransferase
MRTESEMYELILGVARRDERIRAVVLNGSRANPNAVKDDFQDYDVVYFVTKIESFTQNHDWIDVFGKRAILQMPDLMRLPGYENETENFRFAYLMLFKDGNRIDLTLFAVDAIQTRFAYDSLSVLLLDKDNRFGELPPASEADYLIKKPTEKEFRDVRNEFWWVLPYVAKGLARGEIFYAKDALEQTVRKMFMQMIEWHVGASEHFSVNPGKSGKFLKRYVDDEFYEILLLTYPDAAPENVWRAVFLMAEIFDQTARRVAGRLDFEYHAEESENVVKYLENIKNKGEDRSENQSKN